MAGAPYRVMVDRLGGAPTFGRGELIDAQTAAAMHLEATRLIAAGALVGLGPDIAPLVAGYTGTGPLSARPAAPDVPVGATAFYFATDTGALSTWNGTSWSDSTATHPIKFENWDGVVAPALPAGWTTTASAFLVTSTTENPTSAPNSLVYPTANMDGNLAPAITWTTLDGAGGNVRLSATMRFANSSSGAQQDVWVYARASTTDWNTGSSYYAGLARNDSTAGLWMGKRISGVQTIFGGAGVGATAIADATNYRVTLSCQGSTIKAACQRLSDGFWMNSSGVFVADPTNNTWGLSVTDTSIAAVAGYAGVGYYTVNQTCGPISTDDWLLEAL